MMNATELRFVSRRIRQVTVPTRLLYVLLCCCCPIVLAAASTDTEGTTGSVAVSNDLSTTSLGFRYRHAWDSIKAISGHCSVESSVDGQPRFDDTESSIPADKYSGWVMTNETSFTVMDQYCFIDEIQQERSGHVQKKTKLIEAGLVTYVLKHTRPILYEQHPGQADESDAITFTQLFATLGVFPGCLPISRDVKDDYSPIRSDNPRDIYTVESIHYEGIPALALCQGNPVWQANWLEKSLKRAGNPMRYIVEREALTPLAWEKYHPKSGELLVKCRFSEHIPVPGSQMRMPTIIESEEHFIERGNRWTAYGRRVFDNIKFNNIVQKVHDVVPEGAVLVEYENEIAKE